MTIADPVAGEVFSIRVLKSYNGFVWANTYEVQCTDGSATYDDLKAAAFTLLQRERAFHFQWVQFDRYTVSTYVPDGQPYDPTTFTAEPLTLTGIRQPLPTSLPLNVCVLVRRATLTGRAGRHLYRGVLHEDDVAYGGAEFLINSPVINLIETNVQGQVTDLAPLFRLVLASGRPSPTVIRPVLGSTVRPMTTTKRIRR